MPQLHSHFPRIRCVERKTKIMTKISIIVALTVVASWTVNAGETNTAAADEASQIVQIDINVGRGAFRTFHPDGTVDGAHMSGDPQQPFVHQEKKKISDAEIKAIWVAAADLPEELRHRQTAPKAEWKTYMQLQVSYAKGEKTMLSWELPGQYPDPKVQALMKLLTACRVGAW